MFYRITLDLAFTDPDAIDDIHDKVLDHLDNAIIINPGQENEEKGYILTQQCYHDEDPTIPCVTLGIWHPPSPP